MGEASWIADLQVKPIVAIFSGVILLVLVLALLAKKGLFSFNGKGLRVGDVRELITRQMEYVSAVSKEFCAEILQNSKKPDKVKYIRESCKDILDKAIVLNSMNASESYILVKSLSVWAEIQRHDIPAEYRSEEFKKKIFKKVKETIEELVKMKQGSN